LVVAVERSVANHSTTAELYVSSVYEEANVEVSRHVTQDVAQERSAVNLSTHAVSWDTAADYESEDVENTRN